MIVEQLKRPYRDEQFEIVEKKGLGHPDTICDGVSDAISRGLSRYYLDHFGHILHHNVDKVLLIGGRSEPRFGGGDITRPMALVLGGRATDEFEGQKIPVYDIATDCTTKYLKSTLKNIDDHFSIEPRLGSGSSELKSLTGRVVANDTSIGVGFAPFSLLEGNVTKLEPLMRSVKGVGEDVKIMGLRTGDRATFTLAAAIVSKYVNDRRAYDRTKLEISQKSSKLVASGWKNASVAVNAADKGDNIFLTVTGTSAEMGDDGETGRGNRVNGLITPGRPMTLEAHAGKNPVNHVGKIYNIIAARAASEIAGMDGVEEAYVYLVSKIGAPLNEPQIKAVKIYGQAPEKKIEDTVDYWLEHIPDVTEEFVSGKDAKFKKERR